MRAGLLRHKVTIQTATETQDAIGQRVSTWAALATRWAAIEPMTGREYHGSEALQSEVTHKIRLRHVEDVTAKMRVIYGSRTFEIISAINVGERDKQLHLMCREEL